MTTIELPDWPWRMVRRLAEARGVQIWLVGGAVRDALLERPLHDWDFAVDQDASALARAVGDALGGAYFPLDKDRGTSRVVLTSESDTPLELDFALLRDEGLENDLRERDFTINAMALDATHSLIDPLGGRDDLEARHIRATSEHVFQDDAVRLLRATRMEAELGFEHGFEIEPATAALIQRDAALLASSSAERVRDEFTRGLAMPEAAVYVQRLDDLRLLPHVIPELDPLKGLAQSPPHRFDVWRHTLTVMETIEGVAATALGELSPEVAGVPPAAWGELARTLGQFADDLHTHLTVDVCAGRERRLLLKLSALLHDIGKPETRSLGDDGRIHFYNHEPVGAQKAAKRLRRLRFSRDEVQLVNTIVKGHLRPPHLARAKKVTRRAIYRYFRDTGAAGLDIVLLSLADHLATWGPNLRSRRWMRRLEVAELLMSHYLERQEETVAPPPLISGHDLMDALGLKPGPAIGRLLETVREAQAAGEVETREEALALARRSVEQ